MSACQHVAPVTLAPAVMTDLLRAWSTAGLNSVHVETSCIECGAGIRVAFIKHGDAEGKTWSHVEPFPAPGEPEEKTA